CTAFHYVNQYSVDTLRRRRQGRLLVRPSKGQKTKGKMKARLDKDTLITSPEEAQEDFAPAGGIERIVAEIDKDEAESLWEAVAVEEEETPEVAEEASDDVDVDLEP